MIRKDVILPQIPDQTDDTQREWMRGIQKAIRNAQRSIGSPDVTPIGAIVIWAKIDSPPSGWLMCDGSAVSRTEYADLFDVIGTVYGVGDGSTTFNLPNLQRRFVCGYASSSVVIDSITYDANTFGSSNHDHFQGHHHEITAGASSGVGIVTGSATAGGSAAYGPGGKVTNPYSDGTNGSPRTGKFTEPAHIVLNYIIKYAMNAGVDGRNGVDGSDGLNGDDGIGYIIEDSVISYDANNRPYLITYADGQTKNITYDSSGQPSILVWDRGNEIITKNIYYTDDKPTSTDITRDGTGPVQSSVAVRQTVLASALDSYGRADFLSYNTIVPGPNINIVANVDPLICSFANGFNDRGAIDEISKIEDNIGAAWTFGSSYKNKRYYLYLRNNNGDITTGTTMVPPQYDDTYDKRAHVLLHFEGTDESTTFTDSYGTSTWSAAGGAALEADQYKFGSSSLYLDGTGDYITSTWTPDFSDRWSLDFWMYPSRNTTLQYMFSSELVVFEIGINASKKLVAYGSTNNSTWNLFSLTGTTDINTDEWQHIAVEWTGSDYNVYLDGTIELTYASSTALYSEYTGAVIGTSYSYASPFQGYIDEFRFTQGVNWWGQDFTAPTAAYDGDEGDPHFYQIGKAKMQYGNPLTPSWTSDLRLFVGEAETDDDGYVDNVVCYALQGRYVGQVATAGDLVIHSVAHNVGTRNIRIEVCYTRDTTDYYSSVRMTDEVPLIGAINSSGYTISNINKQRINASFSTSNGLPSYIYIHLTGTAVTSDNDGESYYKFYVTRAF